MSDNPKRVLLFSGKRKSGKDYITDLLSLRIGSAQSVIIKISGPIKTHWAKTLNLDYNKLIEDGPYKEQYRGEMNKWAEEIRDRDYGYFCREAIDMYNAYACTSENRQSTVKIRTDKVVSWSRLGTGNRSTERCLYFPSRRTSTYYTTHA
ncbi:probable phosphomevalonate kinase isoform X2 [Cephus cinctus]|uniref:Phosphomevalonate kinase n=1 Tax=Cephus cinctus TaxID=211228 RepID=A0AAJ7W0T6_CEPCN|nr:probable phosphomevalonate kinase isoform X2 [Cephus cinctus]